MEFLKYENIIHHLIKVNCYEINLQAKCIMHFNDAWA